MASRDRRWLGRCGGERRNGSRRRGAGAGPDSPTARGGRVWEQGSPDDTEVVPPGMERAARRPAPGHPTFQNLAGLANLERTGPGTYSHTEAQRTQRGFNLCGLCGFVRDNPDREVISRKGRKGRKENWGRTLNLCLSQRRGEHRGGFKTWRTWRTWRERFRVFGLSGGGGRGLKKVCLLRRRGHNTGRF